MKAIGAYKNKMEDFADPADYFRSLFEGEYMTGSRNGVDPAAGKARVKQWYDYLLPSYQKAGDKINEAAVKTAYTLVQDIDKPSYVPVDRLIGNTDFTGAKSGLLLRMFPGYPYNFPSLQITDDMQLKWWSWTDEPGFYSFDGISWQPNAIGKNPAGYFFTPLYNVELARFLSGYNEAVQGKSGYKAMDSTDPNKIGYNEVNAGRQRMFFRNEVVYVKNGVCYDPNYYSTFVKISPSAIAGGGNYANPGTNTVTAVTGFNNLDSATGGFWAWKFMDGWQMLWRGVQFWIDNFLKAPYNVGELIAYASTYPDQLKKILMKSNEAERKNGLKGFLSVVNFFEIPTGKPGFWDKFASFFPLIWATAATILTAGAGSPLLAAAVGLLSTTLTGLGKQKQAADAKKIYDQIAQNQYNKQGLEELQNQIKPSNNMWLWLLVGGGAFLLLTRKKRS